MHEICEVMENCSACYKNCFSFTFENAKERLFLTDICQGTHGCKYWTCFKNFEKYFQLNFSNYFYET